MLFELFTIGFLMLFYNYGFDYIILFVCKASSADKEKYKVSDKLEGELKRAENEFELYLLGK